MNTFESEIADAIRDSTNEVFSMMLSMDISACEPRVAKISDASEAGVVALLGLAGEWVGSGTVACEPECACELASALLMAPCPAINEEVLDAFAEVANMIIGNVKTLLEEKVGAMGLSTPTVVFGRNFRTRSVGSRDWVIVPFVCGKHTFNVQVSVGPNNARVKPAAAGILLDHAMAAV